MQPALPYLNVITYAEDSAVMENCMLTNSKNWLRSPTRPLPSFPSPVQALVRLADMVASWERRARERKTLAEMSEHMLKDLGISRVDARRESDKPFWRG